MITTDPSRANLRAGLTEAVTATGEEQSPIHNQIGTAIVDACVRAGKEGRKFRVICVIPAIPGFAGDLRQDEAAGTRAIMDYQYKSICRGENSIFGQIEKQGVDPRGRLMVRNPMEMSDTDTPRSRLLLQPPFVRSTEQDPGDATPAGALRSGLQEGATCQRRRSHGRRR